VQPFLKYWNWLAAKIDSLGVKSHVTALPVNGYIMREFAIWITESSLQRGFLELGQG
jgi:hypothetical protein